MKPTFAFSRRDKIGIVTFSIFLLGLTALLNTMPQPPLPKPLKTEADLEYVRLKKRASTTKSSPAKPRRQKRRQQLKKRVLQPFDPNKLDVEGWERQGFSHKQAQVIVNYRQSRGSFRNADDVRKVYVISEKKFRTLEPYLLFDTRAEQPSASAAPIAINSATKEALQRIRGIGPVLSKRIVNYRQRIGGFHSSDQFSEIYGLKGASLEALTQQTTIDASSIRKIAVNAATTAQMRQHPYLDKWDVIAAIVSKRGAHPLTDVRFLLEEKQLSPQAYDRLLPYLSFDQGDSGTKEQP